MAGRLSAKRSIKMSMLGLESHERQLNRKITHPGEPVPRLPIKRRMNANLPRNLPRNQRDYLYVIEPRLLRDVVRYFARGSPSKESKSCHVRTSFDIFSQSAYPRPSLPAIRFKLIVLSGRLCRDVL